MLLLRNGKFVIWKLTINYMSFFFGICFFLTTGRIILRTFACYVTEVTIVRQKEENYTFQILFHNYDSHTF